MKRILFSLLFITSFVLSQNYQQYDQGILGFYTNATGFEETAFLNPNAPGKLEKVFIYLSANQNNVDTIRIVGDPTDGEIPGSFWVSGVSRLNLIAEFTFQFSQAGWYELDVSEFDINVGGYNAIGVSHIIKNGGPYFAIDSTLNFRSSFLNQVFTPNPDFFNIRGTIIQYTQGDYLVAAQIDWDYEDGNNAQKPNPKLVDITRQSGLLDSEGKLIRAAEASIIDYNNDGFDDICVAGNLFINNANGGFEKIETNLTGNRITWADINNDGYLDAFSATGNTNDKIFWGGEEGLTESTPEFISKNFTPNSLPTSSNVSSPLFVKITDAFELAPLSSGCDKLPTAKSINPSLL
jgi:hypothetical protein